MRAFNKDFTRIETYREMDMKPDFNNLLMTLEKKTPAKPVLFEFILNKQLFQIMLNDIEYDESDIAITKHKKVIDTYRKFGYDYAFVRDPSLKFDRGLQQINAKKTRSLNQGALITDRESFEAFKWKEPEDADLTWLDVLSDYLCEGMKLITAAPDGIFETVMKMVGYDNMCFMSADDPELLMEIFDAVGSRYLEYYKIFAKHDAVGALMQDDDWGFNTQTFFPSKDMRKYFLCWHKKFAEASHEAGKPILLHSCGNIEGVMEDVIYDIKYDGLHSFEDNIMPVEEIYEKYKNKIAILGGIDVNFLCYSTPLEIYNRSLKMLERCQESGGYALGSGNSIPEYVPLENYLAMISAAIMNPEG